MSNIPPHNNPYAQPVAGGPNPFPGGGKPHGEKPQNYLVFAILLLVCCSPLPAIPALIYAIQVNSKYDAGDFAGAMQASKNAKMWCIIALCVGLVCNVIVIGLNILMIQNEF